MFLSGVKNIFASQTQILRPKHMFPSLATPGNKTRNIVSATMFPSLARPLYSHVVNTTAKQVISRRGKNENVWEMSTWNENCTCKACKTIVFHYQICKFVTFLLPLSLWLRKLPIVFTVATFSWHLKFSKYLFVLISNFPLILLRKKYFCRLSESCLYSCFEN